tara:strand:+ start:98866 stop:99087 length:222 start_codon:yes stop_codon:yes gene_type:complete
MSNEPIQQEDQLIELLGKTDFTRKKTPTAKVTAVTPPVLDDEGNEIKAGAVSFTNDVGSGCVMTISQFKDMYV